MSRNRFRRRFIAYVDMLGFRKIVERMSDEDGLFTTVRDALKGLDRQSRVFLRYGRRQRSKRAAILRKGGVPLIGNSDLQMTAFSDCYVLSEVSPAWHILAAVQALGAGLLAEGILTRGGVVRGGAYHRGRVLFGPGVIDAYRLESEVAKYPRILVDETVRQEVWGCHEGLWRGQLLQRDVDGRWFVNLLVPSLSLWKPLSDLELRPDLRSHLEKVGCSLAKARERAQECARHRSKVQWLVRRFNKVAMAEGLDRIPE